MFGIGGFELFIILIFGFLIFGPEKLPEIAKTVGRGIARFREAQAEMNETLGNDKIFDPNNPDEPFKDPIEALDKLAMRQEEKKRAKEKAAKPEADARSHADAASKAAAEPDAGGGEDAPRQESFTERKARYERERAARKAAEADAVKEAEAGFSAVGETEAESRPEPLASMPADVATPASTPSAERGGEL